MGDQIKCLDCGKVLTGHDSPVRCKPCAARARYIQKHGQPPEMLVTRCSVCETEIVDYATNRRESKSGLCFCSPECRAAWTGVVNSISRGGDGVVRAKHEKDKIDYRKHSDARRSRANGYYSENRLSILAKKKAKDRETKRQVVDAYGGKCECCGESMIEFLTIDHINNDGALHRRIVGKGRRIYADLIRLGFPKDNYRLLCFNCNIVRGFYGYCPHHPDDRSNVSHKPFVPGRKRIVK